MAITEEEVVQLCDALRGRTFRGTNRGAWQSRNSWDPQIREVIATPQLEGELQRTQLLYPVTEWPNGAESMLSRLVVFPSSP